jgi:hypothetical protein
MLRLGDGFNAVPLFYFGATSHSTINLAAWPHWVKVKNPKAPAVKREAEEDWAADTAR